MPFLGHWSALEVAAHQPVKMAAFENVPATATHVPMWVLGVTGTGANGKPQVTGIKIPDGLSLLLGLEDQPPGNGSGQRAGPGPPARAARVPELPPHDRPVVPVHPRHAHRHGHAWAKRLATSRWVLWLLVICIPLPIIAINLGWMSAEVGRQPWVVQGLLRTSQGVSPLLPASQVCSRWACSASSAWCCSWPGCASSCASSARAPR